MPIIDAPTDGRTPTHLSRDQILDATGRCLASRGYDATTIRTIAGVLDCAVGSIYRYFRDKRELLLSGRGPVLIGVGLALLTAALTLPRFDTRIEGGFVVTPGERAVVRAPRHGVVREVHVTEGASVTEGQVLAVMESPELQVAHRLAESRQALAKTATSRICSSPTTTII